MLLKGFLESAIPGAHLKPTAPRKELKPSGPLEFAPRVGGPVDHSARLQAAQDRKYITALGDGYSRTQLVSVK